MYKAEDPLVVASSNIITLSELSGIVILLFAPSVPVNLIYMFLPLDVAPWSKVSVKSPDASCAEDR